MQLSRNFRYIDSKDIYAKTLNIVAERPNSSNRYAKITMDQNQQNDT